MDHGAGSPRGSRATPTRCSRRPSSSASATTGWATVASPTSSTPLSSSPARTPVARPARPRPRPRLAGPHPCHGSSARRPRRWHRLPGARRDRVLRRGGPLGDRPPARPRRLDSRSHLPRLAAARTTRRPLPELEPEARSGSPTSSVSAAPGSRWGSAPTAPLHNRLDALESSACRPPPEALHGSRGFSGLDALRLATSEGARALGLDEEVGTVRREKAATFWSSPSPIPPWRGCGVDPHDRVA